MPETPETQAAALARLGLRMEAADPERMAMLAAQLRADALHLRRKLPLGTEPLGGPVSGRPQEPEA
ncbi:hypothetical protein [Salipiger abyssi]|uniref:hypothetical protein n=1 Tax=Salipiger abyssi TaxID=1250539 RepID=UPI00405A1A2F